jgi:uncharacterized protein YqeY
MVLTRHPATTTVKAVEEPAAHWRQTLRARLMAARKDRDTTRVSALRSALSAIDNAETPDAAHLDGPTGGTIAGSVSGVGAAEVPRRSLTDAEIRTLLRAEVDERLEAAARIDAGGHAERATAVRAEAAVLVELLGDV